MPSSVKEARLPSFIGEMQKCKVENRMMKSNIFNSFLLTILTTGNKEGNAHTKHVIIKKLIFINVYNYLRSPFPTINVQILLTTTTNMKETDQITSKNNCMKLLMPVLPIMQT